MPRLGGLVGPVVLGGAVWCAAGTIATASPGYTTPRYGVPAPWWVFVAAAALAALVPQIRRHPIVAVPALASTVPWWPMPLPPIALIFTGPLAWLPIAVAVAVAVGLAPIAALGRAIGTDRPSRAPWIAALLTLVLVGAAAWSAAPQSPGGDEPHYLVITQSLLKDGDIRIENNYQQGDYKAYYGGHLDPHYIVPGKNGHIYSIHAPGLAVLVLPGFALAGYRGAQATVMLFAALTGALVWLIGWRVTRDAGAAWFGWAAVATSTTFLIQGFTIYPDGPAMVAVATGMLLLLRLGDAASPPRLATLVAASVPLAALPWVHTRFSVIAAGFGAAIAVRLLADSARPMGARLVHVAAFATVPAVVAATWFMFFKVIYGTFNPTAPYGDSAGNELAYIPGGSLALLFDGQFGLVTYAPVLVATAVGWWSAGRGVVRRTGLETLGVLALYLAATTTYWMWWAGRPAPPARFMAVMLPVFALPLSVAWARGDRLRRTALTALVAVGCGFAITAIGGARGALAWNDRDAQSHLLGWLGPVVNLRRAWPAFFWTLAPDFSLTNLASEWRFAGYVSLFVGLFVALWLAMRAIAWRRASAYSSGARAIVGAWLLGGLMLVAQTGWTLHGVTGLDAAPAQARLLTAARDADVVISPGIFHIDRRARFGGVMTIASLEPGKFLEEGTPWFVGPSLPAGDYSVVLRMDRPMAGVVTIDAGTRETHPVTAEADQIWSLHVDADDTTVVITPSDALRDAGGRIWLRAEWRH